jgi:chemotaxis protein methyltransferase CheR
VPWTHPAYASLAHLLGRHAGLAFPAPRVGLAELGIHRAMARANVSGPASYLERVARDPEALADLVNELTVGETYFFREKAQFDYIRAEVLPDLRRRREGSVPIRAWSAGCASGEEAYSLAILFEEEGFGNQTYLLGTDIAGAALTKARRGRYNSWSLRGEGAAGAERHLQRHGAEVIVPEIFRRRVRFEFLNLAQDGYPSATSGVWEMDLILCRNVLIYVDRDTIRGVARRLYETLAPGGWLFTASSDPPLTCEAPFEAVTTPAGVFYRRLPMRIAVCGTRNEGGGVSGATAALPSVSPPCSEPASMATDTETALPILPSVVRDPHSEDAASELARGNYARACELTRNLAGDAAASALHVRALANLDTTQAERVCAEAVGRHALSTELHYLQAVLLLALRRDEEAVRALQRVLYLDRTLAIAHFTLASILEQRGDLAGAVRAYRNVHNLCAERPADEVAPLADGARVGSLGEASAARLALHDSTKKKDEG